MKIKNKKILYSTIFLLLFMCGLSFGMFSQMVIPNTEDVNTPKSSAGEITLITPENKTYNGPDNGFYPATYGFENDLDATIAQEWVDNSQSGCTARVVSEKTGHKKVVHLDDDSGNKIYFDNHFPAQTHGTIEIWVLAEDVTNGFDFRTSDSSTNMFYLNFGQDKWRYVDNTSTVTVIPTYDGVYDPVDNTWYHLTVHFRCNGASSYMGLNENRFKVIIDGYVSMELEARTTVNYIDNLNFATPAATSTDGWVDAIGFSWDSGYSIGDNLNEGFLVRYQNSTNLEWQGYSLDGQTNQTILGNATIPMPSDGQHRIQIFGNDSIGTMYGSNLRHFTVNTNPHLNIITPENKTYFGPNAGYYPATFGFENDKAGENPDFFAVDETGGYIDVVDEIDGHYNVVGLFDDANTGDWPYFYNTFETPQTYGTYEYWVRTNYADFQGLRLYSGSIIDSNVIIDLVITTDKFRYYDGSWHDILDCDVNRWYHIEIAFECTTGGYRGLSQYKFKLWIDGTEYGEYGWWHNKASADSIQFMGGGSLSIANNLYVDAIGYSWDSNYNIGDNLNEGLLLSYDNTTTLGWKGYSLDNQANKTIMGNTTIPMPTDGSHNIRVYGNTTGGTMYESDLRYFTVNTSPPEITINSPNPSQVVGTTAPSYDLSITGLYDSIWYTLDGGATNITASGLTGTFNQAAWDALADGIITINFYANNSAGMLGTAQVMVFKQTSEEPPPDIPGYDLYLLLGALSVISVLVIRKRMKS